jgi:hypothetical protein
MEELYNKSLQMIRILKIREKKEYNRYKNYYLVLNIESLKSITGKRNFQEIIKIANEE